MHLTEFKRNSVTGIQLISLLTHELQIVYKFVS